MKFFFPDSSDLVDPSFDFERETRFAERVRQRDDLYVHEIFDLPPIDGILVSKAIVDGSGGSGGRYTMAQRSRLLRTGVRRFFRLDQPRFSHLKTFGDCGAFSYVREKEPPFSVPEVIQFYDDCGFDLGLSVDHVILGFDSTLDGGLPGVNSPPLVWSERQELTLALASDFLAEAKANNCRFEPVGVAQGWSPMSYARAVRDLQRMGFDYIAIGGVVPLKTHEIVATMEAIQKVRASRVRFHLLGVTRTREVVLFQRYGVQSFDSTSPLRQAFKDDKDNYYTPEGSFPAIRVPQVEGNPRLQRRIGAGEIDQGRLRKLERECLDRLLRFDRELCSVDDVLPPLLEYGAIFDERVDRSSTYRGVLEAQPWKECACAVCRALGIHVILFRGAERNRRRGFHNIHVFYERLHRELLLA